MFRVILAIGNKITYYETMAKGGGNGRGENYSYKAIKLKKIEIRSGCLSLLV